MSNPSITDIDSKTINNPPAPPTTTYIYLSSLVANFLRICNHCHNNYLGRTADMWNFCPGCGMRLDT